MKRRLALVWAASFALLLAAPATLLAAVWLSLAAPERETFVRLLASAAPLLTAGGILLFILSGWLSHWLSDRYFGHARRLSESARLMAGGNPAHRAESDGPGELRELTAALNLLAERHQAALDEVQERAAAARAEVDRQKNRLAALMAEVTQGVVVCNADGQILLYNDMAQRMFVASDTDTSAAGYLGLGRSVFRLLERDLLAHALEQLRRRLERPEARPAVVFMAALPAGRLVRARLAPVAPAESAGDAQSAAAPADAGGFVLLLEDIGEEVARAEHSDALLQGLAQGVRGALASVRAAAGNLVEYPDMNAARRSQFTGIISDEAERLTHELERTSAEYSRYAQDRRSLEQIRAADLLEVIRHRLHTKLGLEAHIESVDASTWLRVDSYTLVQAVCYLASRLTMTYGVRAVRLAAKAADTHACVELAWSGPPIAAATALAWENDALTTGGESSALTFREVLERQQGEAWYEAGSTPCFRLMLPVAPSGGEEPAALRRSARPIYYDFDLFNRPGETRELDERPLRELAYTVFDTETTGLEPSAGDEIISIGAVRIVNARLLSGETFSQLVDPRRRLQPSSIAIHGIRPEMLQGEPTIDRVLPAFHRFCEDTVLVGHNAAFDMRFLELKEDACGVHFTQPVLDTLLLSAVLHGNLVSNEHQLEAIAERFGIEPAGRHSALGDATLTAEVFLRMIPLLEERGVATLRQAREACQRTRYAGLAY